MDTATMRTTVGESKVVAPLQQFGTQYPVVLLWVDGVGSYRICFGSEIRLGSFDGDVPVEVPLLADIAPHHATIVRHEDGYVIYSKDRTYIKGRQVDEVEPLYDGCQIRLGDSLELLFRQPSNLGTTARLESLGGNRLYPSVNAVVLMADICVLGPTAYSHIFCPALKSELIFFKKGDLLACRSSGKITVQERQSAIAGKCWQIKSADISLAIEPA